MVDDIGKINKARPADTRPVCLRHLVRKGPTFEGISDRLAFGADPQTRKVIKVPERQVIAVKFFAGRANMALEILTVGRQDFEALFVPLDQVAIGPEYVV
ncbi:hypothetical protein ROS1_59040 [Roseibium sp. ROS1]